MESITDVWLIVDIQPFFALSDKKKNFKIQNEAWEWGGMCLTRYM